MSALASSLSPPRWPLLNLGFRPFFLGASLFAVLSIGIWALVFQYGWPLSLQGLTAYQWHAHEMVYGYCLAVIAGFLLTAVRNWTDLPTAPGAALVVAVARPIVLARQWERAAVLGMLGLGGGNALFYPGRPVGLKGGYKRRQSRPKRSWAAP